MKLIPKARLASPPDTPFVRDSGWGIHSRCRYGTSKYRREKSIRLQIASDTHVKLYVGSHFFYSKDSNSIHFVCVCFRLRVYIFYHWHSWWWKKRVIFYLPIPSKRFFMPAARRESRWNLKRFTSKICHRTSRRRGRGRSKRMVDRMQVFHSVSTPNRRVEGSGKEKWHRCSTWWHVQ